MSKTILPLTFGIEIEFLFATQKPKTYEITCGSEEFNLDNYEGDPDDTWDEEDEDIDPDDREYQQIRQSAMILRNKDVALAIYNDKPQQNTVLRRWNLTTDTCIRLPSTDEEAVKWTNGIASAVDDWEFIGLELISPVLKTPDTTSAAFDGVSFRELDRVLAAMQASPSAPYIYTANAKVSSLHVHIGVELSELGTPNDIPLNVLQHLTWMILAYEDAITLLHHPERHGYYGTKSRERTMSNRRIFAPEWQVKNEPLPNFNHTCGQTPVFDAELAFTRVFGEVKSHRDLTCLVSNQISRHNGWWRETMVNFGNLVSQSVGTRRVPTKTVEFRQHHGTLDVQEIKEWVYFVTSLVRAAEKKANEVSPLGSSEAQESLTLTVAREKAKYPMIWVKEMRTLRELFDLMDLPLERRKYWFLRAQMMRSDKFADYFKGGTCTPGACTGSVIRNSEGWEEGELIEIPWGRELEVDARPASELPPTDGDGDVVMY
ncbi:hypothetical protein PV10_02109 [Exophiala mesophila]|uniref:Amidoligase enzyme n=1 Tax=Exophiala mesophila TaxID=212818 RepID=A0A0D1WXY6_EXOME|nr:uncharacterized protein PV10_02109 [Exophiala mesophila]KIV94335.1 hypothetical protein PV10_02109 [Exophiala mesophila]